MREPRQGKGNVVRRMFADIDADIYLMADGDGTYAPEDAPQLINMLLTERSDMAVGTRRGVTDDAGRAGHAFGNRIFNSLYKRLVRPRLHRHLFRLPRLHAALREELSGCLRRLRDRDRDVGARIAAEAAGQRDARSTTAAGRRARRRSSSTFKDGAKILWMFAMLMKETQPLRFFGALRRIVPGVQPGADGAGAGRICRDRAGAAHADLGAVGRAAAAVDADDGDRADPRFGFARTRRAEADLLSQHAVDAAAAGRAQNCRSGAAPATRRRPPRAA